MAAITLHCISRFFADDQRLILRGENAFRSNHVLVVNYDSECKRFSGKVHASMKDKTYDAEIFLTDDGLVQEAKCSCPRGQLKCHHMAAVMVYANRNISSTSVSCKWSVSKKSANNKDTKTISQMYPTPKQFTALSATVKDTDVIDFHQQLSKRVGRHVGFSWLLLPEPEQGSKRVKTVEDILTSKEFVECDYKTGFLLEQLEVNTKQINYVESVTKGQSECALWYMYRKGRITASNFGVIIKAVDTGRYPPSLFKRLLGEYDLSGMKAIQWGKDHEDTAAKQFTKTTGLVTKDSGLWLHKTGILGASPDRLICENAILEVKCPFTHREEAVLYSVEHDKNFILKKDTNGSVVVKRDHPYYHQVQGQLYLSNRDVCFLCIWTLKDMMIIQINKDSSWGTHNIGKLTDFYVNKLIPRILEGGC